MKSLLEAIGISHTDDQLGGFEINRIGQQRSNQNRLIKMNVKSKENRKNILEKAPSLKTSQSPWNKIYLKKDLHPVYIKENQRIHKKMKLLKEQNAEKTVKIVKGSILVDNVVVDKNMFFV